MLLRQTTPLKLFAKANNNITVERNNEQEQGRGKIGEARARKWQGRETGLPVRWRVFFLSLQKPPAQCSHLVGAPEIGFEAVDYTAKFKTAKLNTVKQREEEESCFCSLTTLSTNS